MIELNPERRYRVVTIHPEMLAMMFQCTNWVKFSGLPDGSRFAGWYFDPQRGTHNMILEHESFDAVPADELFPPIMLHITVGESWLLN